MFLPGKDEEVIALDSLGPALAALLRAQRVMLIQVVFSIARVTGQSPQQVLTQALAECDISEEVWASEPKIERVQPQSLILRP